MTDDDKLPPIGTPLRRGEFVRITCDGRTVDGMVVFASGNGRSLMLGFDAMLTGHCGMMPVLQHDDGTFRSIIDGVEAKLERIQRVH